jgi:predicted esterase
MLRTAPVLLIVVALFSAALADVIHMKDGTKVEGEVVAETESTITVKTQHGTVELARSRIKNIEKKKLPQEVYKERLAAIGAKDAEGHYLLALWCKEKGLEREYSDELRKVIEINPDHAAARRRLGYKREGGKWVREGGEPKPAIPDVSGALQAIEKALAAKPEEAAKLIEELRKFDGLPKESFRKCVSQIEKWRSYEAVEAGETTRKFEKSGFTCVVSVPEGYDGKKPVPVIVTLHGSAQTAADMMGAWKASAAADRIKKACIVVAPQSDLSRWWEPEIRGRLDKLLEELKNAFNADTNSFCLSGYENGAHGAWYLGLRRPDIFAAIAPDSGLPLATKADRLDMDSLRNARNLPVYIMNSKDDKVAPGERVALVVRKMEECGCPDVVHDEFPGGARVHAADSWGKACEWFLKKSRSLFPRRIDLSYDGIGPDRAYWLELVEPKAGAKASAQIEGNRFEIKANEARGVLLHLSDRLVNLDKKVTVRINNKRVFWGKVKRSAAVALETCLSRNDRYATYAATLKFDLGQPAGK